MPKPLPEPSILNEESCPQVEVLKTPVTPVMTEDLTSLHELIQRDVHTLSDKSSKHRLQRHLNKEAKVRRSTRSVVLGKAKVMSYEDLEQARKKRAEKE
ncbi:uncharacterized protein BDR25DRAFT_168585, partial [Lindgomyces ingoldianus]